MLTTMPFNVLITGAGSIGAFYDSPSSDMVLTHAHAFRKHEGFRLVGFVDVDARNAQKAVSLWGGAVFSSVEQAFRQEQIDIVCVCVPDDHHYPVLKELCRYPLKMVFAEKPLAKTLGQAEEILRMYRDKNIPLAINYTRRFVPELETIKKHVEAGAYGKFVTGSGFYGKGLLHNGSHMIDLVHYFLGDILKSIVPISSVADYYPDDKSISAILQFHDTSSFVLNHVDCRLFTLFEMDLFFERRRIRMTDLGFTLEEYDVQDSEAFAGYRNIVKVRQGQTSLGNALYYAAENIHEHLTNGAPLRCTVQDGYKTLETCMKIREQYE